MTRRQKVLMKKVFPSTGHANYKQFQIGLDRLAKENELVHKALQLVREEKLDMAIARPSQGRWWIEKVGFKNQYVTKSSEGNYLPSYRKSVEASYTGRSYSNYSQLDDDLKPKYGFTMPNSESKLGIDTITDNYGDDVYIVNKNMVRDRVTLTLGDSLNYVSRKFRLNAGNTFAPETWQQVFVPWSNRELMVPGLTKYLKDNLFKISKPDAVDDVYKALKFENYRNFLYVELQLWGDINLDHIEKFYFRAEPPSKSFYRLLKSKGIEVFDARNIVMRKSGFSSAVKWEPEL